MSTLYCNLGTLTRESYMMTPREVSWRNSKITVLILLTIVTMLVTIVTMLVLPLDLEHVTVTMLVMELFLLSTVAAKQYSLLTYESVRLTDFLPKQRPIDFFIP